MCVGVAMTVVLVSGREYKKTILVIPSPSLSVSPTISRAPYFVHYNRPRDNPERVRCRDGAAADEGEEMF